MPRKAIRKPGTAPNRSAPTFVTPHIGPGDVMAIRDPKNWGATGIRKPYRSLLYAVFAAFAAHARITPYVAIRFLLADYASDRLTTQSSGNKFYPVIVLPFLAEAIEAYLKLRRELGIGGVHLLVDEKGRPLGSAIVYEAFANFSRRCGHSGGDAIARLTEFHDSWLLKETRDPVACVALRHGRRGRLDNDHARADIDAAAADRKRLKRVLKRNHLVERGKTRPIGRRALATARRNAKVFVQPAGWVRELSPAVRRDEVCARLLGLEWHRNKNDQRRKIEDADLRHLVGLLDDGLITRDDIRFLLNCKYDAFRTCEIAYRRSLETPEQRRARERTESEWKEKILALFPARPPGERPYDFFVRMAAEERYPFNWGTLGMVLVRAGLMPAQIARRQKKTSGFRKKSEKTASRSGKRDAKIRHPVSPDGMKQHGNGPEVPKADENDRCPSKFKM